jgi:hypothetical protein
LEANVCRGRDNRRASAPANAELVVVTEEKEILIYLELVMMRGRIQVQPGSWAGYIQPFLPDILGNPGITPGQAVAYLETLTWLCQLEQRIFQV